LGAFSTIGVEAQFSSFISCAHLCALFSSSFASEEALKHDWFKKDKEPNAEQETIDFKESKNVVSNLKS